MKNIFATCLFTFVIFFNNILHAQFTSDVNITASIGYSIPVGKLSELSKPEYSWRIDGEYRLPANMFANLGFERNQFINKPDIVTGARGISKIDNIYLGLKYRIPYIPFNMNIKASGGLFIYENEFRQSNTNAGLNVGIEVFETMFRGIGFSAETGYRYIFREDGNLSFYTVSGGLRFRLR